MWPPASCARYARVFSRWQTSVPARMPDISVVIPTFNRAGLLRDTLAAVLAQTCPAGEIIVVDDGSTDGTQALLAGYSKLVRSVLIQNSGDLVARNVGLREARFPLVAFCDSDDLWEPDFLALMSDQWRSDPDLVACYANFRLLQDGKLSEGTKFDDAPAGFWDGVRETGVNTGVFDISMFRRLLEFQPFFPSCMMVSRDGFLQLGGWDDGVGRIVGGDFATALRVANAPPFAVVKQPLVAIRKHGSNFSGNTEAMNLGDALVLEHVASTRPEVASFLGDIQASCDRRRRAAADSAFSRRDFAAVGDIYKAIKGDKSRRLVAKHWITKLPEPIAKAVASMVSS